MDNIRIEGVGDLSVFIEEMKTKTEIIVQTASDQAAKKVANKVARNLRSTSPSRSGEYRKGWKVRKQDHGEYVVFNDSKPGLTHLLEHGHDVVRNGMKIGRAPAHPHIQQAEQDGIKEFEEEVRKEVERRLSEI